MADGFVSRAQMGKLWHTKRDVYLAKVMASGDITRLPWRVASTSLKGQARAAVLEARRKFKAGTITLKQFEKVFRDQFPQGRYKPTGRPRGRPRTKGR